jgi:hypothetical protein
MAHLTGDAICSSYVFETAQVEHFIKNSFVVVMNAKPP